ncbi:hypothetical protein B5G40_11225 [Flavonifractor sp. An9]|nr:hypothetical protein B5G40_11225 [Flavonifractor sp. An9]OUO74569.1 hypothetical protein B5F54_07550 [Anaeromassilibacillus sp. An250]
MGEKLALVIFFFQHIVLRIPVIDRTPTKPSIWVLILCAVRPIRAKAHDGPRIKHWAIAYPGAQLTDLDLEIKFLQQAAALSDICGRAAQDKSIFV